jgi:hypothetical protein
MCGDISRRVETPCEGEEVEDLGVLCSRQRLIEPSRAVWVLRRLSWLIHQRPAEENARFPLLQPDPRFFPDPSEARPEGLPRLLARLQQFTQLDHLRIATRVLDDRRREAPAPLPDAGLVHREGFAGCFHYSSGRYEIQVVSSMFADPICLVGTLGHELGHVFLHHRLRIGLTRSRRQSGAKAAPPDLEPLTDLAATYLGFGLFVCESAFRFRSWSDGLSEGWSASKFGYLSQAEAAFALGLFLVMRKTPPPEALGQVGASARAYLNRALEFFEEQDEIVQKVAGGLLG